jgi:hypothetical protein
MFERGWAELRSGEPCFCSQCGSHVTEATAEIVVVEVAPGTLLYRAICYRCQHPPTLVVDNKDKRR